jgi:hypothetical protein
MPCFDATSSSTLPAMSTARLIGSSTCRAVRPRDNRRVRHRSKAVRGGEAEPRVSAFARAFGCVGILLRFACVFRLGCQQSRRCAMPAAAALSP